MAEADFHDLVVAWLRDSFADIEHEPTLESGREPDFAVHTPFKSYVVEVEDDFEGVFTGIGQAAYYAAEMSHEPLVVIPADSVESPEYEHLAESERVHIETV